MELKRGPRGFGVELANNYVAAVSPDSSASGKLQPHDVIVALDGELLNERSLAEAIDPAQQTATLTVVRPGPPYVSPLLHQAEVKAELSGLTRKEKRAARAEAKKALKLGLSKRPPVHEIFRRGVLKTLPDGVAAAPEPAA